MHSPLAINDPSPGPQDYLDDETLIDFTTEDDGMTPLVNGQDIRSPVEFGRWVSIHASGPNRGAAIFDSSPFGPNRTGRAPGLLVDQGNVLLLQSDAPNSPPAIAGVFPEPEDDDGGGTLRFTFARPGRPLSIDLIDLSLPLESGRATSDASSVLTLTDYSGLKRKYSVPRNWTGSVDRGEPGVGTIDLQMLAPQRGFLSFARATQDPGFDSTSVVSMDVTLAGRGAIDNLHLVIPCLNFDFETEDDGTPVFSGTPLSNGQDLSTPPEFGVELWLLTSGPNAGATIFDSTMGGPNDPGPDNSFLVGLGNILILQDDLYALQTIQGFFDTPNVDLDGGVLSFLFPLPVRCLGMDLIDVDLDDTQGATVLLLDAGGRTRTFTVPRGWTEDFLSDGAPGFRSLDLTTLAPQPGFVAIATATEDPGFRVTEVIELLVILRDEQALDNLRFCPNASFNGLPRRW